MARTVLPAVAVLAAGAVGGLRRVRKHELRALDDHRAERRRRGPAHVLGPVEPGQPQRFPHVDGFVEPWTTDGRLHPGLRFRGSGRGRCFVVAETVRSGMSCLAGDGERWNACFPRRRSWRAGDGAACGELGDTRFVRWTIMGRR